MFRVKLWEKYVILLDWNKKNEMYWADGESGQHELQLRVILSRIKLTILKFFIMKRWGLSANQKERYKGFTYCHEQPNLGVQKRTEN